MRSVEFLEFLADSELCTLRTGVRQIKHSTRGLVHTT